MQRWYVKKNYEEQQPFYTEAITYLFGVFFELVLNHKNDFNR